MKKHFLRNHFFSNDLSFLLGVAISASFVEALMPVRGISVLLSLYFMFTSFRTYQITLSFALDRIKYSYYFIFLVLIYLLSLLLTSFYLKTNVYFVVQVLSIYGLFLFSPKQIDKTALWRGFFSYFLPLTIIVGFCGFVKAYLLARGYLLEPLYAIYSFFKIDYPPGSSIRPDYNLFSISLLCGTFFIISKDFMANVNKYIYSIVVGVLLLCCYYSSSRRGIFLLAAIPLVLFAYKRFLEILVVKKIAKIMSISIAVGAFLYLSGFFVLTGLYYHSFKLWPNLRGTPPIEWVYFGPAAGLPFPGWAEENIKKYRSTNGPREADISFPSRSYVIYDRSARWNFAWQMLQKNYFVLPMGFSYQEKFGCHFAECKANDYPHNVFLSEFLVGGFLGFTLCIWIFIRHAMNLFSLKDLDMKRKLFVLSVFAFPNLLISGDYLFTSGISVSVLVLLITLSFEQKQSKGQLLSTI